METMENKVAEINIQEKVVAPPLNASEKEIISKLAEKLKLNNITVSLIDKNDGNQIDGFAIDAPRGTEEEKSHLFAAALCKVTGSNNVAFASNIFTSCVYSLVGNFNDAKKIADKSNEILAALNSFKPADEIESMLISKLIVLHFQSMEFIGRSFRENQTPQNVDLNINRSTKLMRLYNETLETLMRYRRKGEQKVTVQHISVGGEAKAVIAGQMSTGGGGQ